MPPEENGGDAELSGRPFWSGTLTFGLVSIPVALYPANRGRRVSLRMLSPDGTPLSRRYFCPKEEKEVSGDDIVRGYEIEKDEFVVVSDEELERLAPERTRDIDLRRFVPAAQIDPTYFQRAYFLAPAGQSTRPYKLLTQAMEDAGRAGVATFVMRGKEYLVAILAENGILRAETLRFHDEVRSPEDVGLEEPGRVPAAAVKKAAKAIRRLAAEELDEGELEDRYAERLLALVRRKQKRGEDVVEVAEAAEAEIEEDVIDLMEVLKRSLAGGGERRPPAAAGRKRGGARSGGRRARTGGGGRGSAAAADGDLRDLSKKELYERAQELEVPGRSTMTKDQLIRAIRRSA